MEKSVLVVGAGLAGISAARELAHRGYHVTVLEARDRVGGRLLSKSIQGGSGSVDLGAAFIHGIDQNPVAALARDLGLTLVPMDDCKLTGSDGRRAEEDMDHRIQALWNKVLDECAEKQRHQHRDREQKQKAGGEREPNELSSNPPTGDGFGDTTEESQGEGSSSAESDAADAFTAGEAVTGEAVKQQQDAEVGVYGSGAVKANDRPYPKRGSARSGKVRCGQNKTGWNNSRRKRNADGSPQRAIREPASLGKILKETAHAHVASFTEAERELWGWHRGNLEISCGADLDELDHEHWNQDDVYDFDGDHVIIKEGYDALSTLVAAPLDVRLNTEVKTIRLDDVQANVEVVVNSGGKTSSLRAGYVIVTLPLGVLKSRLVSFVPALSNAKLAAIRSMGMGTLNKVMLQFSAVFWDQVDFHGHAGKDRRRWLLFMDMSRVTDLPVLVAMTGGPFAVLVERLSDAEVVRRAMAVIRTVYPSAPDPISSEVTRWKTDRFSRGSFSFIPPGCSAEEYDILAEPVMDRRGQPRVLFAGEATTRFHPSTVHGAWLTGLREATRLDYHARAGWHRKGQRKRDDAFSPDVMYESTVLFDPKGTPTNAKPRSGVVRQPRKVRTRPTRQCDGTACRRSSRLESAMVLQPNGKRKLAEDSSDSSQSLPTSISSPRALKTKGRSRTTSKDRRRLLLGRSAGVSHDKSLGSCSRKDSK